ncbi:MAG: fasciclin domain-containing protein [Pirellulales bacterium]|nr:fasciclin domain-containing protein [Pirellulales bacterium]
MARVLCFLTVGMISAIGLADPPPEKTSPNVLEAALAGKHKTFVALCKTAGLAETIANQEPLTVLVPTDQAFEALPKGTLQRWLLPENRKQLVALIKHHILTEDLSAKAIADRPSLTTLQGQSLTIQTREDGWRVSGATPLQTDLRCRNGVIHSVDTVLLLKK